MAAPAWAAEVLKALHIRTREELEAFLHNRVDRRIFAAALKAGWDTHVAPYGERGTMVFSPGALRRWTLSLPVYRTDKRQDRNYDVHGIRFKGDLANDPARESFMRQRLRGAWVKIGLGWRWGREAGYGFDLGRDVERPKF
jgi:hypothetical protein